MRFGKLLFTALLLLVPCVVQAQITNPPSRDFAILNPDGRVTYGIPGDLVWKNISGNAIRVLHEDVDSLMRSLPAVDNERGWLFVVDSLGDGQAHLTVTVAATRDNKAPVTAYVDSFAFDATGEFVTEEVLPGIDFMADDTVTSSLAVGDSIQAYIVRRSFDRHWTSRLTIVPANSDIFEDNTDTSYGLAVPGNKEFMRWGLKGITSSTTDDNGENYLGWGLQYKDVGGDGWSEILVKSDSFPLTQGVRRDTTVTHAIADSTRSAFWGVGTTVWLYLTAWWTGSN